MLRAQLQHRRADPAGFRIAVICLIENRFLFTTKPPPSKASFWRRTHPQSEPVLGELVLGSSAIIVPLI